MLCDHCAKRLDAGETEVCEGCGGMFCEECIDPDIHHCAGVPGEESAEE